MIEVTTGLWRLRPADLETIAKACRAEIHRLRSERRSSEAAKYERILGHIEGRQTRRGLDATAAGS